MDNRRSFINKMGLLSAAAVTANLFQPAWSRNLDKALSEAGNIAPSDLASDEDFWYFVQEEPVLKENTMYASAIWKKMREFMLPKLQYALHMR